MASAQGSPFSQSDKEPNSATTLFDIFEYQGFFWLPSAPDRTVPGVLRYSEDEITLDLLGSLVELDIRQMGRVAAPFRADLILGQSTSGKKLTLYKCTQIATTVGAGATTRLLAQLLLIGKHFDSVSDLTFSSMSVNYLNLEEWIGHQPFPPWSEEKDAANNTTRYVSEYVVPGKLTCFIAHLDSQFIVESQFFHRGFVSFHKDEREHAGLITLEPNTVKPLNWLLERIVDVQDFLTLVIGEPTFPKRALLFGSELTIDTPNGPFSYREDIQLFYHPRHGRLGEPLHPARMLAPLRVLSPSFFSMVQTWFVKRQFLKTVCDLLFGTIYNEYQYLQFQFLGLIQALETYCRHTQAGKYVSDADYETIAAALRAAIPPTTPDDLRNSLVQGKIKYGNEYSLRKRLKLLLDSLEPATVKIVTDERSLFCEGVVATRNYLTHYSSELQSQAYSGVELHTAYLRLRVLLTIVLFKELGIFESAIQHLFQTSHWRLAETARFGYRSY